MSTQNLHMNIYSRFIGNSKTWKKPRYPSIDETLVHPENETLFSAKKIRELWSHGKMWEKRKYILPHEKKPV